MNRWIFLFRRMSRQLWWRASLYAALGVVAALAAAWGAPFAPPVLAERFGGDSVEAVLTILASSLLAVATFSLGAMVTAYTSVSSAATPRAAALITGDESTQKALATFVGAFLYAIVGSRRSMRNITGRAAGRSSSYSAWSWSPWSRFAC